MLSVTGNIRFTSTSTPTDELTFAQRKAVEQMPLPLRELINRDVVRAQWAIKIPLERQWAASQTIGDLLEDNIINPADLAENFDTGLLFLLEEHTSVRNLLKDEIILAEQLAALQDWQLPIMVNAEFQEKLRSPEIQIKLKASELTLGDLVREHSVDTSARSSSGSSTCSTGSTAVDQDFARLGQTAHGALNYASSAYIQRRDGLTSCINMDVLRAIRDVIRSGVDIDTIAIIFDNALRYGYLDELAEMIGSGNNDLLSWESNAEQIEALIGKLEERGLQLKVKSGGAFELSELPMGPVDQSVLQETDRVLASFLPGECSKLIGKYKEGLSFEMALSRRYSRDLPTFKQYPMVLSFLKKTFNEGGIDSIYLNEHLTYNKLLALHQILLLQQKIPFLKSLLKNHHKTMLWFSGHMLTYLQREPNPCHLID